MTTLSEHITVRCPNCQIIIERVTSETMVYCIACRKWCREVEAGKDTPAAPVLPARRPRRRVRCH
ncbi:MAG: hypothetical protein JST84_32260 [Acidobacteria bacterium]|nr:hypothetical protein [Acidobacteriota bacterium]MBS1812885.1 hypothetical protein [Acidobacteriota bacterium]